MMLNERYFHDTGGALPPNHPTYIERKADNDLFNALNNGEFCYVLNARQMGKSSLRTRTMERLKSTGAICTFIDLGDLNDLGNANTDDRGQMKWYLSFLSEIVENFDLLDSTAEKQWIDQNIHRPPNMLLMKFFDEILLNKLHYDRIVIFLDEIDALISKTFKYDFLGFIRSYYNRRADYPEFNRVVFCLLGVVTPGELMADTQHAFNIGKDIELTGLEYAKAVRSFSQGAIGKVTNPQQTIEQIFNWTHGQPFLTQKLCQLVIDRAVEDRSIDVNSFVENELIDNWLSRSDLVKQHLQTIGNYLLARNRGSNPVALLITLGQILDDKSIKYNPNNLQHTQLKLSGIIRVEPEGIQIFNKLYTQIFNKSWIERSLDNLKKIWFPQQELEEIVYLSPPSKFVQILAELLDTKIALVAALLFAIDLLSLYTCYYIFSSEPWNAAFNLTGKGMYIDLFRSGFLIGAVVYTYKYLFYKETQRILILDRLWWIRTCMGILIFLVTIFVLVYNLYLGPIDLANRQPLTGDTSWFRAYLIPYLCYLPYAVINYVWIGIPVTLITTYSSVTSVSNNIKIINIFKESIEKVDCYVDYVRSENLRIEEKDNIVTQMMNYFEKLSVAFAEDFTRYSIILFSVLLLMIFEVTIGKNTITNTSLMIAMFDYSSCLISIILIFFCGASEYHKIFTQACNLLIKIGDLEGNLNVFTMTHSLPKLIARGIFKIRDRQYIYHYLAAIIFALILMLRIN
jgi:AAA-like domain